jgi:hypothetical protein
MDVPGDHGRMKMRVTGAVALAVGKCGLRGVDGDVLGLGLVALSLHRTSLFLPPSLRSSALEIYHHSHNRRNQMAPLLKVQASQ